MRRRNDGDPGPRKAMWSQNEPVTLFGAAMTPSGSTEILAVLGWLGSRFSNCKSFENEVVAADAGGDVGYIVGIERTTASIGGAAPSRTHSRHDH